MKISDQEFNQLASYIKSHYGIHLKSGKKTLVCGRLNQLLTQKGFQNFTEYYDFLEKEGDAQDALELVNRISTNHTFFMRESAHFEFLKSNVLPWVKEVVKDKDLRIWCAASSSGEEPYTLAMILDDFFKSDQTWEKTVLATDISTNALEKAKRGIYSKEALKDMPSTWQKKYFKSTEGSLVYISDPIKKAVLYRRFNLMEPQFPFKKKFHVIFCRNVMIYFDQETKRHLVKKLYDSLHEGGYLFIGMSESLQGLNSSFEYVKPAVYRK